MPPNLPDNDAARFLILSNTTTSALPILAIEKIANCTPVLIPPKNILRTSTANSSGAITNLFTAAANWATPTIKFLISCWPVFLILKVKSWNNSDTVFNNAITVGDVVTKSPIEANRNLKDVLKSDVAPEKVLTSLLKSPWKTLDSFNIPTYSACAFCASVSLPILVPMDAAYSFCKLDKFLVIPALSTFILRSFFKPSEAPLIASPKLKVPCLLNAAAFVKALNTSTDFSKSPLKLTIKFFRESVTSCNGIKPLDAKSCVTSLILEVEIP